MECKKCGAKLPEDSVFCTNCGAHIEETFDNQVVAEAVEVAEVAAETKEKKKLKIKAPENKNGVLSKVELIAGILCIVFGACMLVTTSSGLEYASFGGDFYTYTYEGIYAVARLLERLVRLVAVFLAGFGVFLVRNSTH